MFSDGRARLSGDINRLIDGNLRIKPREMSGKGCVSFSQTITVSGSRWGFISRYSESLFFKTLTRVTWSPGREVFCGLCCGSMWRLLTSDQTLFLLLLGHTCNSPSSPAMREASVLHVEKEMATHSSILAWGLPRTEWSGGQQSLGSQSQTRLSWQSSREGVSAISKPSQLSF